MVLALSSSSSSHRYDMVAFGTTTVFMTSSIYSGARMYKIIKLHQALPAQNSSKMIPFVLLFAFTYAAFRISLLAVPYGISKKLRYRGHRSQKPVTSKPAYQSDHHRLLSQQMHQHKLLFHKLHNIEQNPSVLIEARDVLLSLFAEAVSSDGGILKISRFTPEALSGFIRREEDEITARFESYTTRRAAGGPRELFPTLPAAREWLIERAPLKYVDGAWLGYIHRLSSTPFALRGITKNAWQVLSEELGDGDLAKNHAAIYASLMESLSAGLPAPTDADFITRPEMNDAGAWKGAVAQLLISLFPEEFLPEILGFNLHFEMVAWDTLLAAKELSELGVKDDYFLLHISIDNSDSGHTAMALRIVLDYLEHVRQSGGEESVQHAWRHVQVGYALSDMLAAPRKDPCALHVFNPHASETAAIFAAKAAVASKLHCASRVRLGGRKLVDWLQDLALSSEQSQAGFLESLSKARPWVRPGDSTSSRLVQALEWGGKMFGAFTSQEVAVFRNWIDALAFPISVSPAGYWEYVRLGPTSSEDLLQRDGRDVALTAPVFDDAYGFALFHQRAARLPDSTVAPLQAHQVNLAQLLPLWFAHSSLLESFVSVPWYTCDPVGCAAVRMLRAQRGFLAEGEGVAGMDELQRADCVSLVDIGVEMMKEAGMPAPACLGDVLGLESDKTEFARCMLHWAMRPMQMGDALLGMSEAFVELHECLAVSNAGTNVLSDAARAALRDMALRERIILDECLQEMRKHERRIVDFGAGKRLAVAEIVDCFA